MSEAAEREYVLGTHDEELTRREFRAAVANPDAVMVTPLLLGITAERVR